MSISASRMRQMPPCGAEDHQYRPFGRIHCCQCRQMHLAHSRGSGWMSLCELQTRPAFNSWKTKGAEKLHSLVFLNILRVSVAYVLAAAPSTGGRACLPFCKKSYTWMTLPLCVLVSVFLTRSSTQACTRRWSGSSPAAARCSSLSLSHANTCVPLSPSPVVHTAFMSCLLHHLSHRYFSSHPSRYTHVSLSRLIFRLFSSQYLGVCTPLLLPRSSPFTVLQVAVVTRL